MAGKKKPYLSTLVLGIISVSSYIFLFKNEHLVMDLFTRGGKYAAMVIITAFYFSFVHGAFCSNALEVLGLTAKSKKH